MPAAAVNEAVERFNLATALKRFRSAMFERRVNGLAAIAEAALRSKRSNANGTQWLTIAGMTEWLAAEGILEECFSRNAHNELMRRSADLLKFLGENGKLET